MEKQEIEEGSKLILEFEGFKFVSDDVKAYPNGYYYSKDEGFHTVEECQFHNSWDWLIPVIQKCYKLDDDINEYYDSIVDNLCILNIEATWKSVVEFIKYYNNQQL